MLTEKGIVEAMRGIGSLQAEKYQDSIDMLEDAIMTVQKAQLAGIGDGSTLQQQLDDIAEHAMNGGYSIAHKVVGIKGIAGRYDYRRSMQAQRQAQRMNNAGHFNNDASIGKKGHPKTKAFFKKIGDKIKKGLKAVTKVFTAPERLAIKAMLEVTLPKASPAFLYLFVNDPALIAKLPAKARAKRAKQEKIASVIIKGLGMKQAHFMGILRNGIMKKMHDSPENIIAKEMKGKVAGIGQIMEAGEAAGGALTKILDWIISLFKKKKDKTSDDAQTLKDATDCNSISINDVAADPSHPDEKSDAVADGVKNQPSNTLNPDATEETNCEGGTGQKSIWSSLG